MLHPTHRSLSEESGATPQPAEAPGMGKKGLERWNGTHHRCMYASNTCGGAEGVCLLRSPPHTQASSIALSQTGPWTEAGIADRSLKPSEPVPSETEY
jgi:hypothetical protein